MKDKDFRNMVGDPYLWENCCGGAAMLAADGSVDLVPSPAMEHYADLYVKRKKELIPLMEQYYGQPLPVNATHEELISVYIGLLKNPEFVARLDSGFNNAADPVTAIASAVGGIANVFGQGAANKGAADAAMYQMILAKQGQDNTGKILLFSGIAVVVVGAIITVIILKRRK